MKVKLFSGMYYETLEEELNKFLEGEKIVVKYIKQSSMLDTVGGIFISIFYYEDKKEKGGLMPLNEDAPWQ